MGKKREGKLNKPERGIEDEDEDDINSKRKIISNEKFNTEVYARVSRGK